MNEIVKIKDDNSNMLQQELFYAIKLVGLNPTKILKEDIAIIISFLKGNFQHLKIGELKQAFESGVKGDLDKFGVKMQHFQSFDSLYVTGIIKAYKSYKQEQNAKPKLILPMEKLIPMTQASKEELEKQHFELINDWFNNKGEVPMIANWSEAYLHMEREGLIKIENDEKQMFLDNVIFDITEERKKLKLERANYGHLSTVLESKMLLKKEARKRFIIKYYENK